MKLSSHETLRRIQEASDIIVKRCTIFTTKEKNVKFRAFFSPFHLHRVVFPRNSPHSLTLYERNLANYCCDSCESLRKSSFPLFILRKRSKVAALTQRLSDKKFLAEECNRLFCEAFTSSRKVLSDFISRWVLQITCQARRSSTRVSSFAVIIRL